MGSTCTKSQRSVVEISHCLESGRSVLNQKPFWCVFVCVFGQCIRWRAERCCYTFAIWPACYSKQHFSEYILTVTFIYSLSLASIKSRLVLPFWYRLTWVVPEKVPLNGCVCVCVCVCNLHIFRLHNNSRLWIFHISGIQLNAVLSPC